MLCAVALTCTHAALATHLWFVGRRNKASFYGETQAVRFLEVVFFKLLGCVLMEKTRQLSATRGYANCLAAPVPGPHICMPRRPGPLTLPITQCISIAGSPCWA